MTTSDHHIPDDDIREAFDLAVTAFIHREGGEEPKVTLNGEPCLISTVAVLAETLKEPMGEWPVTQIAIFRERVRRKSARTVPIRPAPDA
jgi:hypothetical protein